MSWAFMAISTRPGLFASFASADRFVSVKGLAERIVDADLALLAYQLLLVVGNSHSNQLQTEYRSAAELLRSFCFSRGFVREEIFSYDAERSPPDALCRYTLGRLTATGRGIVLVRTGGLLESGFKTQHADGRWSWWKIGCLLLTQSYEFPARLVFKLSLSPIKPEMIAHATAMRGPPPTFARRAEARFGVSAVRLRATSR